MEESLRHSSNTDKNTFLFSYTLGKGFFSSCIKLQSKYTLIQYFHFLNSNLLSDWNLFFASTLVEGKVKKLIHPTRLGANTAILEDLTLHIQITNVSVPTFVRSLNTSWENSFVLSLISWKVKPLEIES